MLLSFLANVISPVFYKLVYMSVTSLAVEAVVMLILIPIIKLPINQAKSFDIWVFVQIYW